MKLGYSRQCSVNLASGGAKTRIRTFRRIQKIAILVVFLIFNPVGQKVGPGPDEKPTLVLKAFVICIFGALKEFLQFGSRLWSGQVVVRVENWLT
jgi:hypothetical protein